ncbi:putative papain-like cysteine peptidase superfamily [Helianthus anomalus]
MYVYEKLFNLRSFDMVLFLIIEARHFYLLVFEMKNPAITLIDNGAETSHVRSWIKEMFACYLEEVNHPRGLAIKGFEIKMKKLDWATSGNGTDYGFFLMRHMEKFRGGGVA